MKNLLKTREKILRNSWMVAPNGLVSISDIITMSIEMQDIVIERNAKPLSQEVDGVSVIEINGALMNGADEFDREFGFINHQDIAAEVNLAASEGNPIVLDFTSPGGTHNGTPELARVIGTAAEQVPVVSHTSTMRASAAEFISDAATRITATESAIVGSIGTVMHHVDISDFLADQGIKVEQFTSGPMKAMGTPSIPLTDDQRAVIQEGVDSAASQFKDHVVQHRGVNEAILDGRTFTGAEGGQNGMVHQIVSGIDEAIEVALSLK